MGDISKHFSRHEFACGCGCGFDVVDAELITVLEDLREYFISPIHVNSGARCPQHNQRERGGKNSQHKLGKAADVYIHSVSSMDVADYLEYKYPHKYGIGRYHGRTHIDVRGVRARWDTVRR